MNGVLKLRRIVVVAVGVSVAALGFAAPAGADPDSPCEIPLLCRMLPIAPDLDHDVDLTQDPAMINGDVLPQMPGAGENAEDAPPADICERGCI